MTFAHSRLSVPIPDIIEQVSSKISAARFDSQGGVSGHPPTASGSSGLRRHFCAVPATTFRCVGFLGLPAAIFGLRLECDFYWPERSGMRCQVWALNMHAQKFL